MRIWVADGVRGLMARQEGGWRTLGPPGTALCLFRGGVFCAGERQVFFYDGPPAGPSLRRLPSGGRSGGAVRRGGGRPFPFYRTARRDGGNLPLPEPSLLPGPPGRDFAVGCRGAVFFVAPDGGVLGVRKCVWPGAVRPNAGKTLICDSGGAACRNFFALFRQEKGKMRRIR